MNIILGHELINKDKKFTKDEVMGSGMIILNDEFSMMHKAGIYLNSKFII